MALLTGITHRVPRVGLGLCLCAFSFRQTCAQTARPISEDTALIATVVRAIADSVKVPLQVDPLRLPIEQDVGHDVTAKTWRHEGDLVAARRLGDLGWVGKRMAGKAAQESCASNLLPFSPESWHKGCPKGPGYQMLAVLGAPRPGRASRPLRSDDERAVDRAAGYWSVRVLLTYLSNSGFNTSVCDYVVVKDGGGWRFVERVVLIYIE